MIDRRAPLAKADPVIYQLIRREVERPEKPVQVRCFLDQPLPGSQQAAHRAPDLVDEVEERKDRE